MILIIIKGLTLLFFIAALVINILWYRQRSSLLGMDTRILFTLAAIFGLFASVLSLFYEINLKWNLLNSIIAEDIRLVASAAMSLFIINISLFFYIATVRLRDYANQKISSNAGVTFFALFVEYSIILFLIFSGFYYQHISSVTIKNLEKQVSILTYEQSQELDGFFKAPMLQIEDFAADVNTSDFLIKINNLSLGQASSIMVSFSNHLKEIELPINDQVLEIAILNKNGIVVASTDGAFNLNDNWNESELFKNGQTKTYFWNLSAINKTAPSLNFSAPIFSDDDDFLGVMLVRFSPQEAYDIMRRVAGVSESMDFYLVDKNNNRLSPRLFEDDFVLGAKEDINTDSCFDQNNINKEYYFIEPYEKNSVGGAKLSVTIRPVATADLCLVGEIRQSEVFGFVKEELYKLMIICSISSVILMTFFVWIAEYFASSIVETLGKDKIIK